MDHELERLIDLIAEGKSYEEAEELAHKEEMER